MNIPEMIKDQKEREGDTENIQCLEYLLEHAGTRATFLQLTRNTWKGDTLTFTVKPWFFELWKTGKERLNQIETVRETLCETKEGMYAAITLLNKITIDMIEMVHIGKDLYYEREFKEGIENA